MENLKPQNEKKEIKNEITELMRNYSEEAQNFPFFKNLEEKHLSIEDYSRYFSKKYSTVGYFVDFLKNGAHIAKEKGLQNIYNSFQSNFEDESGIINGEYNKEWEHEIWRQQMLQKLDVKKVQDSSLEYSQMINNLKKEENIFFITGYLTFTELFVAIEMKKLWQAMERDLPKELTSYKEEDIPNNPLEYIKNHADHDGEHYNQIFNAFIMDYKNQQDIVDFKKGMDFSFQAKQILYKDLNKETFT